MLKLIPSYLHGVADYLTAATLLLAPSAIGRKSSGFPCAAGLAVLGQAMMTDYELGAVKILPYKRHLQLDYLVSGVLLAAPLLDDSLTKEEALLLGSLGVMGAAVTVLSDTVAYREQPLEGWAERDVELEDMRAVTNPSRA